MTNKRRVVTSLSWSQISKYKHCPKLWYEQYVLGHWPEEKPQPLCFGIAFHTGAEFMVNDWDRLSMKDALSRFEFEYMLGENKGPNPDKWVPKGKGMLESLKKFLKSRDFKPLEAELYLKRGLLKGKIDCLAEWDGKRTIIDWKTASKPYSTDRVDKDGQLTVYQYLAQKEGVEQVAFCVVSKNTQEVFWYPTQRGQEQIDKMLEEARQIKHRMETKEEFVGKHTYGACMKYNRRCDAWTDGHCIGLDDF